MKKHFWASVQKRDNLGKVAVKMTDGAWLRYFIQHLSFPINF